MRGALGLRVRACACAAAQDRVQHADAARDVQDRSAAPVPTRVRHGLHFAQASLDPRTVGRIVCTKADELRIAHVYVAGAERSRLVQLLAGSVPSYVRAGCKAPLTIVSREQLGGGGGGGA